ncbi:MAG: ribosome recycling factor [Parcubacteria group bacterium]|nr:ribosome recycling factor [Parcubacteria group bacterium]
MDALIQDFKKEIEKILFFLQRELNALRTNRASTEILEHVEIDAYGARMPLKQLGNLSVQDNRTIVVELWDQKLLKDAERAIGQLNLGSSPSVREGKIFLTLPPLNEENRKRLVKVVHGHLEQTRVSLRKQRDEVRAKIMAQEKAKEITEDIKYRLFEDMEKEASLAMKEIETRGEAKEKEIMTV